MNVPPRFAAYPAARPPAYGRWLAAGTTLLALLGATGVLSQPFLESRVTALLAAVVLLLWLAALLLRTLYYRLNRHNAYLYGQEVEQVERAWWVRHRQQVGLRGCLLLGPAGSTSAHWQQVLARQQRPPEPRKEGEGSALRLLSVFGTDTAGREMQLARLLALQWREQLPGTLADAPMACYWLGSIPAWQALVKDMAEQCPGLHLPEQPEAWQGQKTLEAIIERLQGAPEAARILCAGCRCMPAGKDESLPAGEAAVLWLLGSPGQGVRLGRGQWYAAGAESLGEVAAQACRQSRLEEPPEACVSFSQAGVPELAEMGWRLAGQLQDTYWGRLGELEAMVVQTLAAFQAQQQGEPCGWLASSPSHTLVLGVVSPEHESA
ncbi:hypothetical protein SAMN05216189_101659 [Pseudomonas delhiensis]|uniref:Uncharacterized protein n=1 Tax=Pseudomonas delhiensis TaxID=366289 RepID=A0A239M1X0_9PSED|nr:hypothetical protein [Pseudomonas delhiensis]SDJ39028.1 hypothetical protein SAMN05216189_101659 [Pseudomonas delhiensis]SNT36645.1 hypothetical protein SAMN06295949_12359 [Pseudomonas delhiensis]